MICLISSKSCSNAKLTDVLCLAYEVYVDPKTTLVNIIIVTMILIIDEHAYF